MKENDISLANRSVLEVQEIGVCTAGDQRMDRRLVSTVARRFNCRLTAAKIKCC